MGVIRRSSSVWASAASGAMHRAAGSLTSNGQRNCGPASSSGVPARGAWHNEETRYETRYEMFDTQRVEIEWAGRKLVLETGRLARQADATVLAQYGETTVLATV